MQKLLEKNKKIINLTISAEHTLRSLSQLPRNVPY